MRLRKLPEFDGVRFNSVIYGFHTTNKSCFKMALFFCANVLHRFGNGAHLFFIL